MKRDRRAWKELVLEQGKRYRYVLLVIVLGIVLLKVPSGLGQGDESAVEEGEAATGVQMDTQEELEALEERLAEALSQIQGVGRATVVLTLRTGVEQVYMTEGEERIEGEETSYTTTSVAKISTGSGTEQALTVTERSPTFQGALVVCDGGDNSAVKLAVIQSVAALTGLGSDCISVCSRADGLE